MRAKKDYTSLLRVAGDQWSPVYTPHLNFP